MDTNESDQHIEELLPRYCEGKATEAETQLIDQWVAEDESHQKIVNQLLAINLAIDTTQVLKRVDTELALHEVKARIRGRKIVWLVWAQRIAALLSIPLLMSVLWLSHGKEEIYVAQMMEVRTNPGMTTSVVLPDSSVVYLNSESSLRYPSVFDGTREVEMTGEAFFEVRKDPEKLFVVKTPHQSKIEVYGTTFNVEAYDADNRISTTLVKGHIGFFYNNQSGMQRKVAMKPNQRLVYDTSVSEVKLYATNCASEISWKDGMIYLDNTPMSEVLHMLEKRFNVEFTVRNKKFYEYSFTGTFTSQRIERIMEYFRISSRIHWRYVDNADINNKKQQIELY